MRQLLETLSLITLLILTVGCSTPYLIDRNQDAADIFTLTTGVGVGAKARLGPITVSPLLIHNESSGLRGGEVFYDIKGAPMLVDHGILDVGFLFFSAETFGSRQQQRWDTVTVNRLEERGKAYLGQEIYIPFIEIPKQIEQTKYPSYFYTQAEVTVALGLSLRLGFNPGELVDWILGWGTIDIFDDDLAGKKQETRP